MEIFTVHTEERLTALVFKSQSYGEADEIITLYTREAGKIRGLAKAVKRSQSKLKFGLLPLMLTRVAVIRRAGGLSKIINSNPVTSYHHIADDAVKLALWYVAVELGLKSLPDDEPHSGIFDLYQKFLERLSASRANESMQLLVQLKIHLLMALGVELRVPVIIGEAAELIFSNVHGGFYNRGERAIDDGIQVTKAVLTGYMHLKGTQLGNSSTRAIDCTALDVLLSTFFQFYLERDIRSEKFLSLHSG